MSHDDVVPILPYIKGCPVIAAIPISGATDTWAVVLVDADAYVIQSVAASGGRYTVDPNLDIREDLDAAIQVMLEIAGR